MEVYWEVAALLLHSTCVYVTTLYNEQLLVNCASIPSPEFPQHTIKKIIALKEDKRTMLLDVVCLVLLIPAFSVLPTLRSLFKLELENRPYV